MAEELRDRPASWPVESSTDHYRSAWVMAFREDRVRRPGADAEEPFGRLVLEHPGAVAVLAVDSDGRAVCLRQYRHPAQREFVEIPAGLLDAEGEEPLDVARRELREETGLEAADWTPLGTTYSSPGITAEVMHLFLARGLREVGRGDFVLEHEEAAMEVFRVPFSELREAVLEGRVQDAPVMLAVLLATARGLLPGE